MMATWFCFLSVLIYFQDATATSVPVSLQYTPKCEGLRCQKQQQYKVLRPQYVLQPELKQGIQQFEYKRPIVVQEEPIPKCPYGHTIESESTQSDEYQKLLQSVQYLQALVQYQNQEKEQITSQQSKNSELEKYQSVYQHSGNAYQKDYQSSYQQINDAYQQKAYEISLQNVNNGYLPPVQQVSNDIYQTSYQKDSQNLASSSQIQQGFSSSNKVQNNYESLRQQFNNNHLSSQIQQQELLNSHIQQNEHVKTELSQEHQGKIKTTVKYDVSHQQQGYNHHQNQLNVYSDSKSSTNIERHHPIHHHESESDHSEEIDHETGHKKKDHDAYYKFEYAVNDKHTGDIKNHKEERAGDEVRGEYSLVEKDGNVRTVKYFADWKTGFHATVHNSKPRN